MEAKASRSRGQLSRIWLAGLLMVAAGGPAGAHEVRPGYLGIRSTTADRYQVVWKQPALGEMCLRIDPCFPPTARWWGSGSRCKALDRKGVRGASSQNTRGARRWSESLHHGEASRRTVPLADGPSARPTLVLWGTPSYA